MRVFLGMILGALLLVVGVYTYDSMQTSTVANGQVAQANRTTVNWDVAATDWHALTARGEGVLLSTAVISSSPSAHRQWPVRTAPW